ncbi:MAG TPA: thiamine phosphate synthase [Candidatus Dormibacteraeota bacterium]|nr:thiamine phosphate synthase [Candidatus Dormibacteraeota bacterium]
MAAFAFPDPLYPIADADSCADVVALAEAILAGGSRLLQLRAKRTTTRELIDLARAVRERAARAGALLILNDRVDVARLVGTGVHLGQDDLPPAAARAILGPEAVIGLSTHNLGQLDAALRAGGIDYVAFGPIFATRNKENPDPELGVEAVAAARARCPLPLVAIGGLTGDSIPAVRAAGADAVAVIGAIAAAPDPAAATRTLRRISAACSGGL